MFRSADPAGLADLFAGMGGVPAPVPGGPAIPAGPATLTIFSPPAAATRFGPAAPGGEDDRMIALGIRVQDVAAAASMAGVSVRDGTAVVPHEAASGVALLYTP